MNLLIPLFSAFTGGVGLIFDKLNLRRGGIGMRALFTVDFVFMFVTVGAFIFVLGLSSLPFTPVALGLLLALILLSYAQNICEFKGIRAMDMNLREPIVNLEPILAGVLAYLIFPSEGTIRYLIAIIVGVFVVMWSSKSPLSFKGMFDAKSKWAFADASLSAVEDNLTKFILLFVAPAFVPLFRSGGVLLLSLLFMHPHWKKYAARVLCLPSRAGFYSARQR